MKRIEYKYALPIVFALFMSGCEAEHTGFESMTSAENAFDERQSKELVAYMSLETMFLDPQTRSLARAAGEGKQHEIVNLVKQGTDVNSRGTNDVTPLFWAMRSGSIAGFKKLLELGADPNIVFSDGGSVIHWSVQLEDSIFLRLALEHGGNPNLVGGQHGQTPLFKAIGFSGDSDVSIVRVLLKHGADPNLKESKGNTPAMIAAGVGRFDIVYVLLDNAADFNLKNDKGYSLLDRVAAKRNMFDSGSEQEESMKKVIGWLSDRGATIPE